MAKDIFHEIVKEALIKDGWTITHDPYQVKMKNRKNLEIDLGAERTIAAEKGLEKIVVEVKSFLGDSFMHDLYKAVGQYQFYNLMLKNLEPDRRLYLALKDDVYFDNFEDEEIAQISEALNVKLLIFNPIDKTIVEWIK